MRKIKLGVVGAGFWAVDNHIPVLQSRDDVELVGICRLGSDQLRNAQAKLGVPFATENYQELLGLNAIDGVIVSSPHNLHFEHASAALQKNIHVLCEKPMTLDANEARLLVDLAASRQRHFLIPYGWNYSAFAAQARQLVQGGAIGEVEHVLCHMASELRDLFNGESVSWADHALFKPEDNTWSNPLTGGGFAHGQLTHALGLLFWITDLEPSEVFAFSKKSRTGVDLYDAISCRFTSGATGSLGGASTMPRDSLYQVDIRLFGTEGMLLLDLERPRLELRRNDGGHRVLAQENPPGAYECREPIHRFVDLISGKTVENCSPASLGARVVQVLAGASRSAQSGKSERV